ncbi:MAG: PA14 domain-containing protein [Elusimicrobiota bacterium]
MGGTLLLFILISLGPAGWAWASQNNALTAPWVDDCRNAGRFQTPFLGGKIRTAPGGVLVSRGPEPDGGVDWPNADGVVHVSLRRLPFVELSAAGPEHPGDRWLGSFVFFKNNDARDFNGEVFFQGTTDRTGILLLDAREFAARFPGSGFYWIRLRPAFPGQGFFFRRVAVFGEESGQGLRGEYYAGMNFDDLKTVRLDPVVDFDWGTGAPVPGVGRDSFSVRWSGQIKPARSDDYTFTVLSDDGARLWVDGRLLVDRWYDQLASDAAGAIRLDAGRFYDIRMDVYENALLAAARLSWSGSKQEKEVIPRRCLFPPVLPAPVLSPAGGIFTKPVRVAASSQEVGVVVRYRLDGRIPNANDDVLPNGGLRVARTATVAVNAWKEGYRSSAVTRADFFISAASASDFVRRGQIELSQEEIPEALLTFAQALSRNPRDAAAREGYAAAAGLLKEWGGAPEAPVLSPAGGLYAGPIDATIQNVVPGALYRYTVDGREPHPSDPPFPTPGSLRIAQTQNLRVKAWMENHRASPSAQITYQIDRHR